MIKYFSFSIQVAVIEMTSSVNDESRGHEDSETLEPNVAEESILNLLIDSSKLQDQKLKVFLTMLERYGVDNDGISKEYQLKVDDKD